MKQHNDEPVGEYDVGSSTTSDSEDRKQAPEIREIEEEKDRYPSGKPKRIIIRARITHD